MPADEGADIEASTAEHRSSHLRPIVAAVLAFGVVAAVLVVVLWWRRGGPRRAVKELAEIFPAA
jgi:hypothetical protein